VLEVFCRLWRLLVQTSIVLLVELLLQNMCLETAFLHAGLVGDVLDGTEWVVVD